MCQNIKGAIIQPLREHNLSNANLDFPKVLKLDFEETVAKLQRGFNRIYKDTYVKGAQSTKNES